MANKDVTKALTTSDLTSSVTSGSTAPVTSGGSGKLFSRNAYDRSRCNNSWQIRTW